MHSIGFIGAGNMAEALIKGLTLSKDDYELRANDANGERLNWVKSLYGVIPCDLENLVESSDAIILAVKPKDVIGVLKTLKELNLNNKLIMSVAAGIPLTLYEDLLPDAAIVRCMPNTSSAVLHSMTGLAKGAKVTIEQTRVAERIFSVVGKTLWADEEKMNSITAISGSGPAYLYYFTECLVTAGENLGLTVEEAELLAKETLIGAGKMLAESHKNPSELREAVTSPNGTTFAALEELRKADLMTIVDTAAKAAQRRAYEMEGEHSK